MHKRTLALVLILSCLAAAALNACGTQQASTTEAETTVATTTAETTTITMTTETSAKTTTETTTTEATTTTAVPTTTRNPTTSMLATATELAAASETDMIAPRTFPPDYTGYTSYTDEDGYGYLVTTTRKPAIYLYPRRPTCVTVTLTLRSSSFTETIPAYGTGWHVLARPNGKLTNLADGKTYPYLFWEAMERDPWPEPTEGFIVAREDLEDFLREKLAYMGLIPAEYEEFIDYWLPILEQNGYTLIYFAGEEYTDRYPLEISPAPDSMLRVFMVAKPAAGNENIPQQNLKPFERKGFTVIEWGGTML